MGGLFICVMFRVQSTCPRTRRDDLTIRRSGYWTSRRESLVPLGGQSSVAGDDLERALISVAGCRVCQAAYIAGDTINNN